MVTCRCLRPALSSVPDVDTPMITSHELVNYLISEVTKIEPRFVRISKCYARDAKLCTK
jgi:hypothetical protein